MKIQLKAKLRQRLKKTLMQPSPKVKVVRNTVNNILSSIATPSKIHYLPLQRQIQNCLLMGKYLANEFTNPNSLLKQLWSRKKGGNIKRKEVLGFVTMATC